MSSPFEIREFGALVEANRMKAEVRAFQREFRGQMRKAANVVKVDVVHKTQSLFASRGAHKGPSGKMLGPLDRSIGVRILNNAFDVVALIRPRARAFYGRFLETGLNVMRKSRSKGVFNSRSRKAERGSHPFRLPRQPFLEPVAEADAGKVADILGDAYGVFYSGGRG